MCCFLHEIPLIHSEGWKGNNKSKKQHNNGSKEQYGKVNACLPRDYDPVSCLSVYRQKDAIEKAFEMLKTGLDLFPLRARKPSTVRGTIFVLFIALILRSMIVRTMKISGLTKKYSVERMFPELEKLQIIRKDDGSFQGT